MMELNTPAGDAVRTDRLPGMDHALGRAWETWHHRAQLLMGLAESGLAPAFLLRDAGWSQAPHPAPSQRYLSNIPSPPSERSTTARKLISVWWITQKTWQIGILLPVLTRQMIPVGSSLLLLWLLSAPSQEHGHAGQSRPVPSHPRQSHPIPPHPRQSHPIHLPGLRQPHCSPLLQGDPRVQEGTGPAAPRGALRGCRHGTGGCKAGKSWHQCCPGEASQDKGTQRGNMPAASQPRGMLLSARGL